MNIASRNLPRFVFVSIVLALVSCGEEFSTQTVNQSEKGMEEVDEVSSLPPCGSKNEGHVILVKKDLLTRVCVDDEWRIPVNSAKVQYSCSTQKLSDGSGVKVICNGDSVGVARNGNNGKTGSNGDDCTVEQSKDSLQIVVKCGDKKTTINLTYSSSSGVESSSSVNAPKSSSEPDDSKPVSLDSLSGYSHKGPFIKGSLVNLYELESGRTLRQTNGNFVGSIKSDDGRFVFSTRNLISQYALLQATGYYRNEVSGEKTTKKLSLMALTDVSSRNSANVNLLTHLEYDRVFYLVTHDKLKFKVAKKQAQREILSAFFVDTTGIANSEDLNVFGKTKGNAALLAISILLQGDRDIAYLTELLSEISKDMETDGSWDNKETRMAVAEWVMNAEADGRYADFRKNVQSWKLGDVPEFEPILHHFWIKVLAEKDVCKDRTEGIVFKFSYSNKETYFSCKDGYVKATDYWDRLVGFDCSEKIEGETKMYQADSANYKWKMLCSKGSWNKVERSLSDDARVGSITDARDGEIYKTVYVGKYKWMAEHLRFRYLAKTDDLDSSSFCDSYECENIGRRYIWSAAIDSTALARNSKNCGCGALCEWTGFVQGICPKGWHIPTMDEIESLLKVGNVPYSLYALDNTDIDGYRTGKISPYITDVFGFSMKTYGYEGSIWSTHVNKDEKYNVTVSIGELVDVFTVNLDSAYIQPYWTGYSNYIRCVEDY
ncbi:FISUMP domain-containing protein [Fibrobacter sp. UBA4297]|uniref:FISUMP domain-containing protein n=1 Tax=Fibrobacter sp. UBA4297 TaxID=1946536 RepID=UPI0025C1E6DC|nr:FISUMP domain-containing protein [Fibrobacter sp. UBA4297]